MSIKAFPLNQQEYSYNAQDVMKYYAGRNSGVFETGDNLKVSANGGLELRINTGMGWLAKDYVASVAFWNESVEYLMVEAGHDTYNRIDLVVVSWNFIQQEQNPKLIIRKGTPASSPAVPALVNDSSTIEIALARINVGKGAITLSNSNIVDLRGNDTYCPMVYDEQTIRNAFVNCVGYADGVKKISDFPNVTPTANDKLLVENGGTGKSATIKDAVNTCSLTLEEIQATTDLTGKVASASSVKELNSKIFSRLNMFNIDSEFKGTYTVNLLDYLQSGEYSLVSVTVNNSVQNPDHVGEFLGFVAKGRIINTIVCQGHYDIGMSITDNTFLNISKNFTWAGLTVRVTVI